jgi:AraC family transcriptional regulator
MVHSSVGGAKRSGASLFHRSCLAAVGVTALVAAAASAQESQAPPAAPAPEVKLEKVEAVHALILPMKGSYSQHADAFARLSGFLSSHGTAPLGPPFARYFSDPSVPEAELVWEVGFPVAAGVAAEPPFEIRDIPGGTAAVALHNGPYETLGASWQAVIGWVMGGGYQPNGPATQVFLGDPMSDPRVELRLPVAAPAP